MHTFQELADTLKVIRPSLCSNIEARHASVKENIIYEPLHNKGSSRTMHILQVRDKNPVLKHPTIDVLCCSHNIAVLETRARNAYNSYAPHRRQFISFIITESIAI